MVVFIKFFNQFYKHLVNNQVATKMLQSRSILSYSKVKPYNLMRGSFHYYILLPGISESNFCK